MSNSKKMNKDIINCCFKNIDFSNLNTIFIKSNNENVTVEVVKSKNKTGIEMINCSGIYNLVNGKLIVNSSKTSKSFKKNFKIGSSKCSYDGDSLIIEGGIESNSFIGDFCNNYSDESAKKEIKLYIKDGKIYKSIEILSINGLITINDDYYISLGFNEAKLSSKNSDIVFVELLAN